LAAVVASRPEDPSALATDAAIVELAGVALAGSREPRLKALSSDLDQPRAADGITIARSTPKRIVDPEAPAGHRRGEWLNANRDYDRYAVSTTVIESLKKDWRRLVDGVVAGTPLDSLV
jgi:hypothetical protein